MPIILRNVRKEDLDQVAAIEAACFLPKEAASRQSLRERIRTFPDCFLVAETDGRLIGFINGCATNSPVIHDELFHNTKHHLPAGANLSVFGLAVLPEYRNKGIAAQLMNRFIELAKTSGRQALILTCKDRLVHYYETFGYVNNGLSGSTHGGAQWFDMTLALSPVPV